jgi:hypothetical protein
VDAVSGPGTEERRAERPPATAAVDRDDRSPALRLDTDAEDERKAVVPDPGVDRAAGGFDAAGTALPRLGTDDAAGGEATVRPAPRAVDERGGGDPAGAGFVGGTRDADGWECASPPLAGFESARREEVAREVCRGAAAAFLAVFAAVVFAAAVVFVAIRSLSHPGFGTVAPFPTGRRRTAQSTNGPVPSRRAG